MTKRYTVRDERSRWLATVVVCLDGLVLVYGMQNGTFGHFWAGERAFEAAGIFAFLKECSATYAARKLTLHLPKGRKTEGIAYIERIWPQFVNMLHDEKTCEVQA